MEPEPFVGGARSTRRIRTVAALVLAAVLAGGGAIVLLTDHHDAAHLVLKLAQAAVLIGLVGGPAVLALLGRGNVLAAALGALVPAGITAIAVLHFVSWRLFRSDAYSRQARIHTETGAAVRGVVLLAVAAVGWWFWAYVLRKWSSAVARRRA